MPSEQTLKTIEALATLVENHGAMTVFAIISGLINVIVVSRILRGRLVPYSLYKITLDDNKSLKETMAKERDYMENLLEFMRGLKKVDEEEPT